MARQGKAAKASKVSEAPVGCQCDKLPTHDMDGCAFTGMCKWCETYHSIPRTCQCHMLVEGLCELCQVHESLLLTRPNDECDGCGKKTHNGSICDTCANEYCSKMAGVPYTD